MNKLSQSERLAAGSIAIGILVLGLKTAAWRLTGSAALFSDAAETVVNVAAAAVGLFALRFAAQPADANHPYGHDKAEFFAAVIEGVLIVLAALGILDNAWHAYREAAALTLSPTGIGINAAATVINALWASLLLRRGTLLRSPTLRADGQHLMSDVVTSVGILIGVGLVWVTGIPWLDPLFAALTALYILIAGAHVVSESVSGLMDAAPAGDIVTRIRQTVAAHAAGAIEAHDLRTRHSGRLTFLEFHLVVPGEMTVFAAHDICDRIEIALREQVPDLRISIHVEPEGKAKHSGVIVL